MTGIWTLFVLLFACNCSISLSFRQGYIKQRHSSVRAFKGLQMGVVDRVWRMVRSNVNYILNWFEDPEKIMNQAVSDMQSDLIKLRLSLAEVISTHRQLLKKMKMSEIEIDSVHKMAEEAIRKGDEVSARNLLAQRQAIISLMEGYSSQLAVHESSVLKIQQSISTLNLKIEQAKLETNGYVSRAKAAQSALKVNDLLSTISDTSTASGAYQRMKEKIEGLEVQAEISNEFMKLEGDSASASTKYRKIQSEVSVEEELLRLKQNIGIADGTIPMALRQTDTDTLSAGVYEYQSAKT